MELIILGSGTSIPLAERGSPCLAVMIDNMPIIFDMGPGAVGRMTVAGLDFEKIRQIFITHFHPDHTADLIHFLFASRNPAVMQRRMPFSVRGPKGIKDLIQRLQHAYSDWLTLPPELMTVEEFETGKTTQRDFPEFRITCSPADHTPQSLAYRIADTRTGKSLVYSGDTGFCDDITELAKDADLLVLNCAFPDDQPVEGHLTPSQAGQIATMAQVNQLVLAHFYPEILKTDIESQCRRTYQGKLLLAKDFMRIPI